MLSSALSLQSLQPIHTLYVSEGLEGPVTDCVFSPDNKTLIVCAGRSITLWDFRTGEWLKTLWVRGQGGVSACAVNSSGTMIVSGGHNGRIELWDIKTEQSLKVLVGHTDCVKKCLFSPDGQIIVSCSADKTLKLWDAQTGECLNTLEGHTDVVGDCDFSPDSKIVASSSWDATIKLWNVRTGECFKTLVGHNKRVFCCKFNPSGTLLVSGEDSYGFFKLWDVASGQCQDTLDAGSNDFLSGSVIDCAFSPDGNTLLLGISHHQGVQLWDMQAKKRISHLPAAGMDRSCAFSLDGKIAAYTDTKCDILCLAALAKQTVLVPYKNLAQTYIRYCAFSPDGRILATCFNDSTLKLYDAKRRVWLQTLRGHTQDVTTCIFTSDGAAIISASNDKTLRIWDAQNGQCLKILEGHTGSVDTIVFNSESNMIVSGALDKTIKFWDRHTGVCQRTLVLRVDYLWKCLLSPNGKVLVSYGNQTLKFWDTRTGSCLKTLKKRTDTVTIFGFSPDSKVLILASHSQNIIELWDIRTGQCLKTLQGHAAQIVAATFSPDGAIIASTSKDDTFNFWDIRTAQCIRSSKGDEDNGYRSDWRIGHACVFSPDGKVFISTGKTMRFWDNSASLQPITLSTSPAFAASATTLSSQSIFSRIRTALYPSKSHHSRSTAAVESPIALTATPLPAPANAVGAKQATTSPKPKASAGSRSFHSIKQSFVRTLDNSSDEVVISWQQQLLKYPHNVTEQICSLLNLVEQQQERAAGLEQMQQQLAEDIESRNKHIQDLAQKQTQLEAQLAVFKTKLLATADPVIAEKIKQLTDNQTILMQEWEKQQEIKRQEDLIYREENLRLCYCELQCALNAWFAAYLSLASGKVERTSLQRETAVGYFNQLVEGASFPGIALITKAAEIWAGNSADKKTDARAAQVANVGISITRMDQVTASTARLLVIHYKTGVLALTLEGAKILGQWCFKPIVTYLYHIDSTAVNTPDDLIDGMFKAIQQANTRPPRKEGWLPSLIGKVKEYLEKDVMLPLKNGSTCSVKLFLTNGIPELSVEPMSSLISHQVFQHEQKLKCLEHQSEMNQKLLQTALSGEQEKQVYIALYSYTAQENEQLSFIAGQELIITTPPDPNIWHMAINNFGQKGWVPGNYVRKKYLK